MLSYFPEHANLVRPRNIVEWGGTKEDYFDMIHNPGQTFYIFQQILSKHHERSAEFKRQLRKKFIHFVFRKNAPAVYWRGGFALRAHFL